MTIVALIPARAGSKRVPGKNTRLLAGHPLIAYTIAAAQESGVFSRVLVSTDSREVVGLCDAHGWDVCIRSGVTGDDEPDIVWVRDAMTYVGPQFDAFAILRPTSPFRSAAHIRQAYARFCELGQSIDSLRAVRRVREHPCKMWVINGLNQLMSRIVTGSDFIGDDGSFVPSHSRPTHGLWPYFVQTSSLEIAWTRVLHDTGTISGTRIAPWIVEDANGFSIDTPADWREAEGLIASGAATLPPLPVAPLSPVAPAQ